MPPVNVRFHEEAAAEVEAARQWYAERSLPAAEAFRAEIDLAVERVRNGPERWPRFGRSARRYILPRFPFSVIYRIKDTFVEVVAVAHHRRKPGYWQSR